MSQEKEHIRFLIAKNLQYKKNKNPNKHEKCLITHRLAKKLIDEFEISSRYKPNEEIKDYLDLIVSNSFGDEGRCLASDIHFNLIKPKSVEVDGSTVSSQYTFGIKYKVTFER